MDRKYWASRKRKIVGPFATRDEAVAAFRQAHPFKGPDYAARAKDVAILSGYGEFGPHFDIRWDHAREMAA